jgi:predicted nuclease of predicted toxin-antitoxin system
LRLIEFDFLTDENIHPRVVTYLRDQGCDVLDVKESGMVGSSDLALIRAAYAQNRVMLTHDSDFGALAVAMSEPIVGIVYIRPGHIKAEFTISTLATLLERELELSPPFIIIAQRTEQRLTVRVRKPQS